MHEQKQALEEVRIAPALHVRNMAIFPLIAAEHRPANYVVLSDAIARRSARISETSEAGQVPRLSLFNDGDLPVLLLDGEELIGCKQNRTINLSILGAPHSEIHIPVSCVEQGRWRFESRAFAASEHALFSELRAAKVSHVSASLERCEAPSADQSAIWEGISRKAARMGTDSESAAMAGIFRSRKADLDEYLNGIGPLDRQIGAVFAINGRVQGLELFDAHATCAKYLQKVASGYALDAVEASGDARINDLSPQVSDAQAFIDRVVTAREARYAGVSLGEDIRLEGESLTGAALAFGGRLVHLCAFDMSRATEAAGEEKRAPRLLRRVRSSSFRPND